MEIELIHQDTVLLKRKSAEPFEVGPTRYEVVAVGDKCTVSVGETVLYLDSIPGEYELEDTYYVIKEELLQVKLK